LFYKVFLICRQWAKWKYNKGWCGYQ